MFSRGADGELNGLEPHQGGYEHKAQRVAESTITAIEAQLADRVTNKIAVPRSEKMLRRAICQHQQGETDYACMTPPLAQLAREQCSTIRADLSRMGSSQDVSFKSVSQHGWDVYDANFENGKVEWRFILTADGRFSSMLIRPSL